MFLNKITIFPKKIRKNASYDMLGYKKITDIWPKFYDSLSYFLHLVSDHGLSGNPVFDYYWGTELYPRIFGWDVKVFTNCRCGMMFWALSIISYASKQHEIYGYISSSMLVSVSLQLIYITKFYWWETGYLRTIDIMHDRAGILWRLF